MNVLDSAALQVTTSVVHGNHVHHTSVAIDVDGTSGPHVSVYNNVLQHSTGYGLWFGAPSTAAVSATGINASATAFITAAFFSLLHML